MRRLLIGVACFENNSASIDSWGNPSGEENRKIIRIEYTEASGEKKQKLTKASNSRFTFKR